MNSSKGLAERITSYLSSRSFTPFDNLVYYGVIAVLHRGNDLVKGLGRFAAIAPDCQSVEGYCIAFSTLKHFPFVIGYFKLFECFDKFCFVEFCFTNPEKFFAAMSKVLTGQLST